MEIEKVEYCFSYKDTKTITWINVDGVHEIDIIEKIGNCYGLHPLIMEDIVNTGQWPKIEDFDTYLYFVIKMHYQPKDEIVAEQVSIVIGNNFVLLFQENQGDVFDHIGELLRNAKGRIRKRGAGLPFQCPNRCSSRQLLYHIGTIWWNHRGNWRGGRDKSNPKNIADNTWPKKRDDIPPKISLAAQRSEK